MCVRVCMCVCMHVCMDACMYVCMHIRMHVHMYVCTYLRLYACMHVCMFVAIYVRMYACMHVCMLTCMHVRMFVCICKPRQEGKRMMRHDRSRGGSISVASSTITPWSTGSFPWSPTPVSPSLLFFSYTYIYMNIYIGLLPPWLSYT